MCARRQQMGGTLSAGEMHLPLRTHQSAPNLIAGEPVYALQDSRAWKLYHRCRAREFRIQPSNPDQLVLRHSPSAPHEPTRRATPSLHPVATHMRQRPFPLFTILPSPHANHPTQTTRSHPQTGAPPSRARPKPNPTRLFALRQARVASLNHARAAGYKRGGGSVRLSPFSSSHLLYPLSPVSHTKSRRLTPTLSLLSNSLPLSLKLDSVDQVSPTLTTKQQHSRLR